MDTHQPPGKQREAHPDLSVVIVSWNVRLLLIRCLEALHSPAVQDDLALEIIVVDNASRDGSADAVSRFSTVKLIRMDRNLGYGRANNQGFHQARGRHLLVLNPDTEPMPGSLCALLEFADKHPSAAIVSPRLLNPDGSVQRSAFRFPTLAMAALDLFPSPKIVPGRIRHWLQTSKLNGRYPDEPSRCAPFRIDHPLGACILINRSAYKQLGGFDPALFMYSEEVDLALRYARAGWESWQVPEARVVHYGGQSTRQSPDRMLVELWRSRLYIYSKHYSGMEHVLLRAMLAFAQTVGSFRALGALATRRISAAEARRYWRRAANIVRLALR